MVGISLLLALASAPSLQTPKPPQLTLASYLATHPWDAAKAGPMVVLQPERTRGKAPAESLEAFDRKLVTVGHLSAIVPRTMIVIDDSLSQSPNMYEGLPPDAKVLYLLKSLTDDQWRAISDAGLSLNDLQGEQRLVLASLLPKPLSWTASVVDEHGMWGKQVNSGAVSDDDLSQVRLKVQRFVDLRVYLDGGKSQSFFGSDRYKGPPGSTVTSLDLSKKSPEGAFGLKIRSAVDNQAKPSDLDYSPLSAKVTVPPNSAVKDVLKLVGAACRLELIPDIRVAKRTVTVYGDGVAAGELLKALAECVTGTYRRVGSAYVLASDVTGMGNRKLRISTWEDRLQHELWKHEDDWRHEIGKHSGFMQLQFGGGSTAPTGDELDTINKADQSGPIDINASQMTQDIHGLLELWDHEYTLQPISKDKVAVSSKLNFTYVLPDGTQLFPVGDLGARSMFLPPKEYKPPVQPTLAMPMAAPKEIPLQIVVRAGSEAQNTALIERCAAHQVKRLWLECEDPAVLAKAVANGAAAKVEIALIERPWRLPKNADAPDRTLFGEHGAAVTARMAASVEWSQWLDSQRVIMWELYDLLSPTDGALAERWQQLTALAQTPGLAGVALIDTQPSGYEPKRDEWRSALGPIEWAAVGYGYTDAQRLAFLRAHGVDPIDLGDNGYWTTAELRQPFFLDNDFEAIPNVDDDIPQADSRIGSLSGAWRTYILAKNRDAIVQLATSIGRKVFIDMRPNLVNTMPSGGTVLKAWMVGDPLPLGVGQQTGMFEPGMGGIVLRPLPEDPLSPAGQYNGMMLKFMSQPNPRYKPGDFGLAFDMTQIPADRVGATLDRWFLAPGK